MSDRLEWADTTSGAELLFPGEDIDGATVNTGFFPGEDIHGATVNTGEIALAFWTGSNGIALSGPPQDLAERLEQAAIIVRAVVPLQQPLRHLPDQLDPLAYPLGTGADSSEEHHNTLCHTPGTTVADPRRVTCGNCVTAWNAHHRDQYAFPVTLPISPDPDDRSISDQLPYASITWISDEDRHEQDDGTDGDNQNR